MVTNRIRFKQILEHQHHRQTQTIVSSCSNTGANPPVYVQVCTDRAGTNVFYELNPSFDITSVSGGRDSHFLNGGQANAAENMDGSITDVRLSNQL